MSLSKRAVAEFLGTFWLVFGGCGSAVLAAAFPQLGIGLLGVALAFGLTVLTMAFAIGHISGCHLNPAVSVGLWVGKRFPANELIPYIVAQVLGGIAGRVGSPLSHCVGESRIFHCGWIRCQRLRGPRAGGIHTAVRDGCRDRADVLLLDRDSRLNRQTRAARLRTHRHRACFDPDSPDWHTGDESFGEPGAQYRTGDVRRRVGTRPALDVLACPDHRSCSRRRRIRNVLRGDRSEDRSDCGCPLAKNGTIRTRGNREA